MKNKTKYLFVFLLCLSVLEAKRNQCCSNEEHIRIVIGCNNNGTAWHRENCARGAYEVFPSDERVNLSEFDDTLFINDYILESDQYCVGSVAENTTIILVCFPTGPSDTYVRNIIVTTCAGLSVLSLLTTLIIYFTLPKLQDLLGICIMSMIFCLLLTNTTIIVLRIFSSLPVFGCYFVASLIYFSFLGAMMWMNVIGFHIWKSLKDSSYPKNKSKIFKLYNIYAWGYPLVMLLITLIANLTPGNHIKPLWGNDYCWFPQLQSALLYFHIPSIIIISLNIILFILATIALKTQTNTTINNKYRSRKYKFLLYLKLFITMGICWIFEPMESILVSFDSIKYFWMFTEFINASQGVIIFLLLIVFRKRVRKYLGTNTGMCCRKLPEEWATIANEDIEELSEDEETFSNTHTFTNE